MTYKKYKNKKTTVDSITFDSKKEARRYQELKLLEKADVIKNLRLQPKYILQEKYKMSDRTVRAIYYIADFEYFDKEKRKIVVEDVKGIKTDVYKLKKKLFEHKYNLEITEI